MNILIIGNGFDLAHDLETRYEDFLTYCGKKNTNNMIANSPELDEEFNLIINNNIWYLYLSTIIPRYYKFGHNWVDFESEIGNIITNINELNYEEKIVCNSQNVCKGYVSFEQKLLIEPLKSFFSIISHQSILKTRRVFLTIDFNPENNFVEHLYIELRKFTRALELYCLHINYSLDPLKIMPRDNRSWPGIKNEFLLRYNINYVLSFNYTNTFEQLYNVQDVKFCYIHGKAQKETNNTNLIFGIGGNFSLNKINSYFKRADFNKFYQRLSFKTGTEYMEWISQYQNSTDTNLNIHIVGHSFGNADYDILSNLVSNDNFTVYIYYYSSKDLNIKMKKIINLLSYTHENGKEVFMRRYKGFPPTIKFIDQYDEQLGLFNKKPD